MKESKLIQEINVVIGEPLSPTLIMFFLCIPILNIAFLWIMCVGAVEGFCRVSATTALKIMEAATEDESPLVYEVIRKHQGRPSQHTLRRLRNQLLRRKYENNEQVALNKLKVA